MVANGWGGKGNEVYRFSYSELSAYARTERLILSHFTNGEIVVDVGCGYGALAERCRDAGYTYIGLDIDEQALKDLDARGFETRHAEIAGTVEFRDQVVDLIGGRSLAGILMLDVLEHLVDAREVLQVMRGIAVDSGVTPMIICIPNVTHYDLGAKLIQGRWDETEVGILDKAHVGFYDARKLTLLARETGWRQIDEADFRLDASDQHFPADNVALTPGTPLNSVLRHIRDDAAEGPDVIQFVRAFVPGPQPARGPLRRPIDKAETPFLSVLTRTQGNRLDTLQETLLCLAGQSYHDFEVLILAHNLTPMQTEELGSLIGSMSPAVAGRFRIVPVTGRGRCRPLNVGVKEARGTYISVLDDDDIVLGNWVEVFKDLADLWPGRVLRSVVAEQEISRGPWPDREGYQFISGIRVPYPLEFDLFDHIVENRTPPCGLAFPRSCFRDLNLRFDESLPVLEDWDVLLQTAFICGVASSKEVTSIYRRWSKGLSSTSVHTAAEWYGAHQAVIAKLDRRASIFPAGSITRVRELQAEVTSLKSRQRAEAESEIEALRSQLAQAKVEIEDLKGQHAEARAEIDRVRISAGDAHELKVAYESSASWRLTAPLRNISARLRRLP